MATLDLDGSGAVGLYFTYGPMGGPPQRPWGALRPGAADRLLVLEDGAEGFVSRTGRRPSRSQIGGPWAHDHGPQRDGVPDVVVSNLGQQPAILMGACTAVAWTWVRLEQPDSNVHAIGAEVMLTVGDRSWSQTILGGGPGRERAGAQLHFGLGTPPRSTRPSSAGRGAFSELDGVCAGCVVTLRRGDPLGG